MFKFIALSAILSLNICCLGSSESPISLTRTASGNFFDTRGKQTTMVDFYMTKAQENTLPKKEGFLYHIDGRVLPKPEADVIEMISKLHFLATYRKVLSITGDSKDFTPQMLAETNRLGKKINAIKKAQQKLLPEQEPKCSIQ